jgi:hypothetical protein
LKIPSKAQSVEPFQSVRLDIGISKTLCFLNFIEYKEILKQILVLSASDHTDLPFEHTMNTVFAAHRINVVIDSIFLNQNTSVFLDQASIITKGFCVPLKYPNHLLQYLFSIPNLNVRYLVEMSETHHSECRVLSADSHKMINQGYLCSICMILFESSSRQCPICKSRLLPFRFN